MDSKSCSTCAFNGLMSGHCYFPNPQDGTEGPMVAPASMPDVDGNGKDCHHWRKHEKR